MSLKDDDQASNSRFMSLAWYVGSFSSFLICGPRSIPFLTFASLNLENNFCKCLKSYPFSQEPSQCFTSIPTLSKGATKWFYFAEPMVCFLTFSIFGNTWFPQTIFCLCSGSLLWQSHRHEKQQNFINSPSKHNSTATTLKSYSKSAIHDVYISLPLPPAIEPYFVSSLHAHFMSWKYWC